MRKKLAFVLSGGGAHGALQVGALRALFEAGIIPDMLVGTSIGAVNSALIAIYGLNLAGIEKLSQAWFDIKNNNLMTSNFLWLGMRTLLGYKDESSMVQLRKYLTSNGLSENVTFGELKKLELYLVAADLKNGSALIYGNDPEQSIMEGVLGSAALPPWMHPLQINGHYLVDGGVVSNLPIEPALSQKASHIYALDLFNSGAPSEEINSYKQLINQVVQTYLNRQRDLELKLAKAVGIPVEDILLFDNTIPPFWDFNKTEELIERGYEITRRALLDIKKDFPGKKLVTGLVKMFRIPG